MLLNVDIAKKLLSKTVSDPYGRKLGKIVGFSTDSKKSIASIGIELNNGDFQCYPCSQISIENDSVIINYLWKEEAEHLAEEFALILRKNSALNKLHNGGEISPEVYDEMQKQHEATMKDLVERCQALSDELRGRIKALNIQIGELKTFLANVKIEYLLGNVDEECRVSSETLQTILSRILLEKEDMEIALNNIPKNPTVSQIMSPEPSKTTNQSQPIVLRIKEAEP